MWEYNNSVYPDELYHWKYIKRYKGSNGKWRYVYADKNTHNDINKLQTSAHDLAKLAAVDRGIANRALDSSWEISKKDKETNKRIDRNYEDKQHAIDTEHLQGRMDTEQYSKLTQSLINNRDHVDLSQYTRQRYKDFKDMAYARAAYSRIDTKAADRLINNHAIGAGASELISKGKEYISKLFKRK